MMTDLDWRAALFLSIGMILVLLLVIAVVWPRSH